MDLGVRFPFDDLRMDTVAMRDYLQGIEALGYTHMVIGEHVVGADPTNRPGWDLPYTHESFYHEPLTFLAWVAGQTKSLLLVPAVLVLPMRQTALVAKQASEVDNLSGGRLRLGIGVGSNEVEYEAMSQDYHTRGRRIEEQVALLRAYWTQPVVTFEGRWEKVFEAGINPMPVQRPIPIWFGGGSTPAVLKRIARLGDGWMPTSSPKEGEFDDQLAELGGYLREAGRDPAAFAIAGRTEIGRSDVDSWRYTYANWQRWGATSLAVGTSAPGVKSVEQHLDVLRRYKAAVEG